MAWLPDIERYGPDATGFGGRVQSLTAFSSSALPMGALSGSTFPVRGLLFVTAGLLVTAGAGCATAGPDAKAGGGASFSGGCPGSAADATGGINRAANARMGSAIVSLCFGAVAAAFDSGGCCAEGAPPRGESDTASGTGALVGGSGSRAEPDAGNAAGAEAAAGAAIGRDGSAATVA